MNERYTYLQRSRSFLVSFLFVGRQRKYKLIALYEDIADAHFSSMDCWLCIGRCRFLADYESDELKTSVFLCRRCLFMVYNTSVQKIF